MFAREATRRLIAMQAFALALGITVAIQLTTRASSAPATPPAAKVSAQTYALAAESQTILVNIRLTKTTLIASLSDDAKALLATTQGTTAARRAAQRNPQVKSNAEVVAASIAESSRNAALPAIRRAAKGGIAQSNVMQDLIARRGAKVISASPLPNQIVARIPASLLAELERNPNVASVTTAKLPVWMSGPGDESYVWRNAGFTGQGSSLDGKGSPDFVVVDTGARTTHNYFKSRLPEDCPTCDGTGPSRITSPVVRNDFSGSKHTNVIVGQVASTALSTSADTGMAYGIDKVYDAYQAYSPYLWLLGISAPRPSNYSTSLPASDPGLGGLDDLPEVFNYSAGIYEDTTDLNTDWRFFDSLEANYGMLTTVSAGNCGIATPSFTNCADGPHRVSTPTTNYNVLSVGAMQSPTVYPDTSGYEAWENTSPGPTWGGRKKPDVITSPFSTGGNASQLNDTGDATGIGSGTSYAAPKAAAGALLLASVGVYKPTAQKAILINSATPVQGQTYWMPRTGWGALSLDKAFTQRGNYANAEVHGAGPNSARFFETTGVSVGDRATLVWNRRTGTESVLDPSYYNLTNLDLSQISPADSTGATVTSTGGSDAADTVDTDQTFTDDNPMPGNGDDGGDNVEQIRSTATGTQILKVKALSSVDGATTEPFSIAARNPVNAIASPIASVDASPSTALAGPGQSVTINATSSNPSSALALTGAQATINLPGGVSLTAGTATQSLGTLASGSPAAASWTVQGSATGVKNITVTTSGTAYGETFAGSDAADFTVDADPPILTLDSKPQFSPSSSPSFSWSAADALSSVASYDAEVQIDGGSWTQVLDASTDTSYEASGSDGQLVAVRVRARDTFGNLSDWSEASTTIDTSPPVVNFGPSSSPVRGAIAVPVSVSSAGSPVTSSSYSFAPGATAAALPLPASPTYFNKLDSAVQATLIVTATDALGRATTRSQIYTAGPKRLAPALRISSAKAKRRVATVSGTIAKEAAGTIFVTIQRTTKKGTRRVVKEVRASGGRYKAKIRLKPGRYKATVLWPGSTSLTRQSLTRQLTVR